MDWFEAFHAALRGAAAPSDLKGPRGSGPTGALAHYRRQYVLRIRHAVEVTFPLTRELAGEQWESLLESFVADEAPSPRSLDHHPALFADFLVRQAIPELWMETARFECVLDTFPWAHPPLIVAAPPDLTESSVLLFGDHAVFRSSQVVEGLGPNGALVVWSARDGARHRRLPAHEWRLWCDLLRGDALGVSLSRSSLKAEDIQEFFAWLVSSGLLRGTH